MKKFKEVQVTKQALESLQCDICQKEYGPQDFLDTQEFLHINFVGGFGSIFGDMNRVHADICQDCLKDKLGEYLKIDK